MNMNTSLRYGIIFLFLVVCAAAAYALTFEYIEGDLVRLVSEAQDDDNDNVTLRYSAPLDGNGEWQTTYNDAGTYEITITADDGETTTEEKATLVILDKNQAPTVSVDDITVSETELVEVVPEVDDLDENEVSVRFSRPLDEDGQWQTSFGDAGNHTFTVTVSDGELESSATAVIHVLRKNRPPRIVSALPRADSITMNEGENARFSVSANDDEKSELRTVWRVDGVENGTDDEFTFVTDYSSDGVYVVTAVVSDGEDESSHEWEVTVQNVNQLPVLEFEDVTLNENESVDLELPEKDADGEFIDYAVTSDGASGRVTFENGIWQTTFDDAGVYNVTVTAADGVAVVTKTFVLTVTNVDRAPEFLELSDVIIFENESLTQVLEAQDPDGDIVTFTVEGLEGATVSNRTDALTWSPTYDTVSIPDNFLTRLLRRLRLDKYIYSEERTDDVTVTACGAEACSSQDFALTVNNVNRLPVIDPLETIFVQEGDTVIVYPNATDLDGDYVSLTIGEPLGNEWETGFDSAGDYTIPVTAWDGKNSAERNIRVIVGNVNRAPSFDVVSDQSAVEGEEISFTVDAVDPDGDNLTLVAEDMPEGATFADGTFHWTPGFESATARDNGLFIVTFSALDRLPEPPRRVIRASNNTNSTVDVLNTPNDTIVKTSVQIDVRNVNRPPVLTKLEPAQEILAFVNRPVVFAAEAVDPDGDELTYSWDFGFLSSIENQQAVRRRFTTAGQKQVGLTVSDGEFENTYTWFVTAGRPKPGVNVSALPAAIELKR